MGMDAGIFNPCFFAFLVISNSIFNIFKYYFYTIVTQTDHNNNATILFFKQKTQKDIQFDG